MTYDFLKTYFGKIEEEFSQEFLKDLMEGKLSRGLMIDVLGHYGLLEQIIDDEYEALQKSKGVLPTKENVDRIYANTICLNKAEIRRLLEDANKPDTTKEKDTLMEMWINKANRMYS